MINIEVNGKIYSVDVVMDDESKEKGLQGVKGLPEDHGMLFCYEEPSTVGFWMKHTLIPLDIIFIDEYGEVISVHQGEPDNETPMIEKEVSYVLEVNIGSGIKPGDEVDLTEVEEEYEENEENEEYEEHEEEKHSKEEAEYVEQGPEEATECGYCHYFGGGQCHKVEGDISPEGHCKYFEASETEESSKMHVLNEKGETQMELDGGERIFSRIHTRKLISLSKKAAKSKKDADYKKLGKKVFEYIDKQNTQGEEYTHI